MHMASVDPLLSVIIPAFNEAKRSRGNFGPVISYLQKHFPDFELIIIDDGSQDDTAAVISKFISGQPKARLISYQPNHGKGFAVRTGVLASRGDQVLFMDADLSTPLSEIPKILTKLKTADIVIGSRGKADSKIKKPPPLHRKLASFIFDQIKFAMVGLRQYKDTQCGFKAFRGSIARNLFAESHINRFMFDVEILYMAEKAKLTIQEIPVTWADTPDSTVRFWEGVVNMFRDLWRIRTLHSKKVSPFEVTF